MGKSPAVNLKAVPASCTLLTILMVVSSSGSARPALKTQRQRAVCSLQLRGAPHPETLESTVASAELDCTSISPVSIGINSTYLGKHMSQFRGVRIISDLPCQQQAQGWWNSPGGTNRSLLAMLYFCGDYDITLLQPRVLNVTLEQSSSDWFSAILAFGGTTKATVLQGSFVGNSADSTVVAFQTATLVIQDHSVFHHNRGSFGTGITATDEAHLVVRDATFNYNKATMEGGAVGCYLYASISIDSCLFRNNAASSSGGAVELGCISGQQATISNTTFQGNSAEFGGAAHLDSSTISIENSSFTANQASVAGGALGCDGCTVQAHSLSFTRNNAVNYGGGLYAGNQAQATVSNTTLQENGAAGGGAVYLDGNTTISIGNSSFTANDAIASGGALYCDGCKVQAHSLSFTNNTAVNDGGGLYAMDQAQVNVTSSTWHSNTADNGGGVAFSTAVAESLSSQATLHISESTFKNNVAAVNGGACSFEGFVQVVIVDSNISSCAAGSGGAVFLPDQATLQISGSSFWNNAATLTGGVVHAEGQSKSLVENSAFSGNHAGYIGGALYINNSAQVFVSHNCSFVNNSAQSGGAISIQSSANFKLSSSSLLNNSADFGGGALRLSDKSVALVTAGSIISGNSAAIYNGGGGGVYASENSRITINGDTKVQGNIADIGGGVYASDSAQVVMERSSVSSNQVTTAGGGFYLDTNATGSLTGCLVTSNVAGSKKSINGRGGGLASTQQTVLTLKDCLVVSNTATGYGGGILLRDTAKLMLLGDTNATRNHADSGRGGGVSLLSDGFDLGQVRHAVHNNSGKYDKNVQSQVMSLTIVSDHSVYDFANRIGKGYGLLLVSLVVTGYYGLPCQYVQVQAVLQGTFLGSSHSDEHGLVHLGLSIVRPPGVYVILLSSPDAPDVPVANLTLHIRSCVRGEVTPSADACQPCLQGFFSFDPSQEVCSPCPGNANCSGGDVITPLPGYWRSSTDSVQIHRCPNPTACNLVGDTALRACTAKRTCGTSTTYKDLQCAPGYYGNVCGLCLPGTGATRLFACRGCMKSGRIIALYILAGVVLLCLVKLMCHLHQNQDRAANHADDPEAKLPAAQLLRPLLLYSQYMLIVSSMPVEWPASIGYPLKVLAWVWSSTSPETLSIDCLLPRGTHLPISIQKVLFYVCTPLVILGLLLLVDMAQVHYLRAQQKDVVMRMKDLLRSSALVAVFFFYPSILRNFFSMFACIAIDQPAAAPYTPAAIGSYWVMDMNQQCFTGYHRAWSLGFGLPCVLLVCLGLPLGVLVLMLKKKAHLAEPAIRHHYGFLYMSYRRPIFCWECVVMIQTMVLVAISVFGVNLGVFYQVIVMNAALILMEILLQIFKPYAYQQAGQAMLQAFFCLLLTSYISLTFLQWGIIQPSPEYGIIMGCVVLLVNLVYVVSVVWQMIRLINWKQVLDSVKRVRAKLLNQIQPWLH